MRYKITVENITDPTDRFEMQGDAVIAFLGKVNEEKKEIEHGMGFAGSRIVMGEVINTIPYQIKTMLEEDAKKRAEVEGNHVEQKAPEPDAPKIVLPKGYDNKKTKN